MYSRHVQIPATWFWSSRPFLIASHVANVATRRAQNDQRELHCNLFEQHSSFVVLELAVYVVHTWLEPEAIINSWGGEGGFENHEGSHKNHIHYIGWGSCKHFWKKLKSQSRWVPGSVRLALRMYKFVKHAAAPLPPPATPHKSYVMTSTRTHRPGTTKGYQTSWNCARICWLKCCFPNAHPAIPHALGDKIMKRQYMRCYVFANDREWVRVSTSHFKGIHKIEKSIAKTQNWVPILRIEYPYSGLSTHLWILLRNNGGMSGVIPIEVLYHRCDTARKDDSAHAQRENSNQDTQQHTDVIQLEFSAGMTSLFCQNSECTICPCHVVQTGMCNML